MNKQDLINEIAKLTGQTKADTSKCLDAFEQTVNFALTQGDDVRLIGFGTFSVHERKATTGRNPRTGEPIKLKASKNAKFKAGKNLKDSLNT